MCAVERPPFAWLLYLRRCRGFPSRRIRSGGPLAHSGWRLRRVHRSAGNGRPVHLGVLRLALTMGQRPGWRSMGVHMLLAVSFVRWLAVLVRTLSALAAGLLPRPCTPTSTPIWLAACKGMSLLPGSRHIVASGVRCVASACLPAMPFTLPVGHRPAQQPVLHVECPGRAQLHCPPSLRSKLVARPPFAISRQRQGPCGARFSPKLWRPWCATMTLAAGKIFWPCPSVC